MNGKLGEFKKLDVRNLWPHEAKDFTPWLAGEENIALLGQALGIELEVEKVEAAVGPYSADILAKDGKGQFVVIENQLEKTNHDHLGKAITYGSVLNASSIVWIASDFTEEHQRALDWLNDNTSEDLGFYGVHLELWKIDDSKPAVRFNVISRPAVIKKKAASGDTELTEARQLQLAFWTEVRDKLLSEKVISSAQSPRPQYWFDVSMGRAGIHLSNTCNTYENHIGVRLYIGNKVAEKALPQLMAQKDAIEAEMGVTLQWDPNPDARDKVIVIHHKLDVWDESKWPEGVDWLVDMVSKFRKAFIPRIKKLKLSK